MEPPPLSRKALPRGRGTFRQAIRVRARPTSIRARWRAPGASAPEHEAAGLDPGGAGPYGELAAAGVAARADGLADGAADGAAVGVGRAVGRADGVDGAAVGGAVGRGGLTATRGPSCWKRGRTARGAAVFVVRGGGARRGAHTRG